MLCGIVPRLAIMECMSRLFLVTLFSLLVSACSVGPYAPISRAGGWHRGGLNVGAAFIADFDTTLRLDSSTLGRGTKIELENVADLDNTSEILRLDGFYRFNRKHRIDASYFNIERDSTLTVDRQIQIGDAVFPINASLTTSVDTRVFKADYRYTILPEDTWELSASFGFHWLSTGFRFSSQAISVSEEFDADLPLPVLGLHGEWHLHPRVRFKASTELLYVELSDVGFANNIEGLISDTLVAFEWEAIDHLGIGVGYNYFYMDVDVDKTHLSMSMNYEYHAVLVYAQLTF